MYSQEALDRIISNLMDANPQSNAPPPATEDGLARLDRRRVTDEMLADDQHNRDCPICIDALKRGDAVIVLHCKHMFHDECVTLWLRQHNTCPVCRTPIEKNEPPSPGPGPNNNGSNSNSNSNRHQTTPLPSTFPFRTPFSAYMSSNQGSSSNAPPSQQQNRPRAPPIDTPPSTSADARFRRDSRSPTSPTLPSRSRQRSPPRDRERRATQQEPPPAGSALSSWFRGRWRSGSSSDQTEREERERGGRRS